MSQKPVRSFDPLKRFIMRVMEFIWGGLFFYVGQAWHILFHLNIFVRDEDRINEDQRNKNNNK